MKIQSRLSCAREKVKKCVLAMWKQKSLRYLLAFGLLFPVLSPMRVYFELLPRFTEKLQEYSCQEAIKTATHFSNSFVRHDGGEIVLSDEFYGHVNDLVANFGLEKIKVFSADGRILYSTVPSDIGRKNEHAYFYEKVMQGEVVSKLVAKSETSLEGRRLDRDVAEIYIPIAKEGRVVGAFELYYDLTLRKDELENIVWREAIVATLISGAFFVAFLALLVRASTAMQRMQSAEEELRAVNSELEARVEERTQAIRLTQEVSIYSLAMLAEYYDTSTSSHLHRIRAYCHAIAVFLSRDSAYAEYLAGRTYAEDIAMASVLHDIGKIAVPHDVLIKPGKLTPDEFESVKVHTQIAGDILSRGNDRFYEKLGKDSYLALAADIAASHHEKWNGSGYPAGMKGEQIPLSARIVAVADVYDALRSERPYKKGWTHEEAIALIQSEAGRHFDPEVVRVFMLNEKFFAELSEDADGYCKMHPEGNCTML